MLTPPIVKLAAAMIVGFAALTGACALLTSFDGFEGGQRAIDAGTVDGAVAPPPDEAGAGCTHARWPPPPEAGDGDGDPSERVGAIEVLHVVDADDGGTRGFDLDGLCTCPEREACRAAGTGPACDAPGTGIDNAALGLFQTFVQTGVALDDNGLQRGLRAGRFGVVFRLLAWNGDADDSDVRLEVYNAVAVNRDAGAEARFDGNDDWVIDEDDVVGPLATYSSERAYVAGGVLVASFALLDVKTRILSGASSWVPIDFVIANAVVTGRLVGKGSGLAVGGGVVAGRMLGDDVLAQTQRVLGCGDSPSARSLQAVVCNARDLPTKVGDDGTNGPCQSISVALGFELSPAKRGPVDRNDDPDACAPPPRCP